MRLEDQSSTEYRYRRITEMYKEGKTQKEIAEVLGCSQAWVSRVLKRYRSEGDAIFDLEGVILGRKPMLTKDKMELLKVLLKKGAREYGFETDRWTQERIADLIEARFGVKYHHSHISRLMKKLDFSLQKRGEKLEIKTSESDKPSE